MVDYINEFNKGKARKTKPEYRRAYRKYGAKAARKVGYSDFMEKKKLPKDELCSLYRWFSNHHYRYKNRSSSHQTEMYSFPHSTQSDP